MDCVNLCIAALGKRGEALPLWDGAPNVETPPGNPVGRLRGRGQLINIFKVPSAPHRYVPQA